jgi:O-antigen/teichoic acid export membrane protein
MSLKQKTIKGLFWSGASQAGKLISQFIITVILARLLSPSDFGLLAMATVFLNFGMIFSEMGIGSALIQKQDTHDRHYYSAFWLNIIVGIALTFIFIAVSPLIAWFYKKPELQLILTVISVNYFISSFVVIQQTILTKEMDFRSLAIRDIFAVILSGVIGIYLAYHGFGVWSLIFQSIAFTFFNAVLLWGLSSWRPKFQFAMTDIKDIFNFSSNMAGFNILNYFARNLDQLLIGKFLGAQLLGYYSLAYKLMLYPLQNISWVVTKVMFPAFSRIQEDLMKVRQVYLKMIKSIAAITFPLMFGLFAIAPEFISLLYGPKWSPVSHLIRILCFAGIVQSILTTGGSIYQSQGRPDIQLKMSMLSTSLVVLVIFISLRWGIYGVALGYTIFYVVWSNFSFYIIGRIIHLDNRIFYSSLFKIFLSSLLMMVLILVIKNNIFLSPVANLLVITMAGVCIYFGLLLFFKEIVIRPGRISFVFYQN